MKQEVKSLIGYLKTLNRKIEELLNSSCLEEAKEMIDEYAKYLRDADYYSFLASYKLQIGEFNDALQILIEGIGKHPFHYEMNYNLGIIYETKEAIKSLEYYTYACKYARGQEEKDRALDNIQRVSGMLLTNSKTNNEQVYSEIKRCRSILNENDGRAFPLDQNGKSLVRNILHAGTDEELMVNMYKSFKVADVDNSTAIYFKTELFKGKNNKGEIDLNLKNPAIVPISLIEPFTKVDITVNNEKFQFEEEHFVYNRYHYLKLDKGNVKIKTNKNIFVGNPIEVAEQPEDPKLILKIFIDGLAFKFLEQKGMDNLMPNTNKFFRDGFISTNCYATSEWTLPSKASINTGKYATNHKLLHPTYNFAFEKFNELLPGYLKKAGYFTTKICTNWRTTPSFGYYKGFDRIVYQNFCGGMDCGEVIAEAIEHLEAFEKHNKYVSISLMDLHNVPDEIEDTLYGQTNTDLRYRIDTKNKGETSVLTKYDENKIIKYYQEIKRVDVFLGTLFDYISNKYTNDEILVVLHSDHGQTFLENEKEQESNILHDSRRKIPLMIKGNNVPNLMSDEIIEAVDILPIILELCGIEIPNHIDGKLPKSFGGESNRQFAITQVLHPNQSYKAAISDDLHLFYFETKDSVGDDLSINVENFTVVLINKETQNDDTILYAEKVNQYEQVVFELIKDFIRWNKEAN
ncbi:conserved hypothetical protein [Brevibacillus brevis NBRC 100599]|uniref:Sulfatase N-terminal domain-containing protein n=1 Tax=Brevibacillus brevis (strain 47 / JCM 6285 / NBRC 100599) TaxID=358681 RepID=C0Z6V0_BREBN|nr:sulfatase-like hydrolase/transferase [Brevibacillus brevis]BAH46299.1 conserved hypothetical protein [Brevibacillus brevis NBRC 100599]